MLDELSFRNHADSALAALKQSLYAAEEDGDFEVEEQSGVLNVIFEVGTKFVFTPNAPVRQIWISALTTSFKLDWDDTAQAFVLPQTGESLLALSARLLSQQTGNSITLR